MASTDINPTDIVLQVFQDALHRLANTGQYSLPPHCSQSITPPSLRSIQKQLSWPSPNQAQLHPLRLLFDSIDLSSQDKPNKECPRGPHYWPALALPDHNPTIPKPQTDTPDLKALQQELSTVLTSLTEADWNSLSILSLILEKYASHISYTDPTSPNTADIALFDLTKTTAAVAAAIAQTPSPDPKTTQLSLIVGDLSGIQSFIYTIASAGALKSLRARSFYLELITEEIAQQVLTRLDLPRSSVIYVGGGNLYLLAPACHDLEAVLDGLRDQVNRWFLEDYQGKLFLALTHRNFSLADVGTPAFASHWAKATQSLATQKQQKFCNQLSKALAIRPSYEPCKVCHRDDLDPDKPYQPLNKNDEGSADDPESHKPYQPLNKNDEGSPEACPTCRQMFDLGSFLLKVRVIVRSPQSNIPGTKTYKGRCLEIKAGENGNSVYYHLFQNPRQIGIDSEAVFLINNWNLSDYRFFQTDKYQAIGRRGFVIPLLLGNYAQTTDVTKAEAQANAKTDAGVEAPKKELAVVAPKEVNSKEKASPERVKPTEQRILTAEELAARAKGINRVGYVRMDVDRLGQMFANGLCCEAPKNAYDKRTLPRIAGLSRQMSYFFKVYLNSLAENRSSNKALVEQRLTEGDRKDLVFIYAGGDDLFISGAWDQLVEFSFDIYQAFRSYTGQHPEITLSGGLSLSGSKYPLYRSAAESGDAEHEAKGNGRDSLSLFGEVFKWGAWLGHRPESVDFSTTSEAKNNQTDHPLLPKYLTDEKEALPDLFGIWPLVQWLNTQIEATAYPRAFVRNLLATAHLQRQMLETNEWAKVKANEAELKGIRYYLHLPKVAYTLARLPSEMQKKEGFEQVRQALKNPYNAPYFQAIATWIELLNRDPHQNLKPINKDHG